MTPLTSDSWTGLPVFVCHDSQRRHASNLDVPVPMLVLWSSSDIALDIRLNARQQWHFRTRSNHFDLYAAGTFESVLAGETSGETLIVALPPLLVSSLLGNNDGDLGLDHCRFQFGDRALERLVRGLVSHSRDGEPLGALYTQSLSVAILDRLAAISGRDARGVEDRPLSDATRRALLDLIEGRLARPPRNQEMALVSGLATGDFLRAFKLSFGMTPHQFLLERRIERAKSLLVRDKPLTTLALELGFASHAHFTATFRARTGHTPTEYRRNSRALTC